MLSSFVNTSKYILSEEFDNDDRSSKTASPASATATPIVTNRYPRKEILNKGLSRSAYASRNRYASIHDISSSGQKSKISRSSSLPGGKNKQKGYLPVLQKQSFITHNILTPDRKSRMPPLVRTCSVSSIQLPQQKRSRIRDSTFSRSSSRQKPMDRFRTVAIQVKNALNFLQALTSHLKQQRATASFAQFDIDTLETPEAVSENALFDPSYFKAVRDVGLSAEAIRVLSKNPALRTEDEIQTVIIALKASNSAYREYPRKMQVELALKGWYEQFNTNRVIIRQGHTPLNFYLIVSGAVIVSILTKDKKTGDENATTVAVLSKGTSFGEVALLHKRTRTATVTCKTQVGLLVMSREDFVQLFEEQDGDQGQEHVRFLRSLPYLQWLPLERLHKRIDICMTHYFRDGVIIDRNLMESEWIYIVKTGSCKVLAKLVKPKGGKNGKSKKHKSLPELSDLNNNDFCRKRHRTSNNGSTSSCSYDDDDTASVVSSRRSGLEQKRKPMGSRVNSNLSREKLFSGNLAKGTRNAPKEKNPKRKTTITIEELVEENEHLKSANSQASSASSTQMPKTEREKMLDSFSADQEEYIVVQTDILYSGNNFGLALLLHQSNRQGPMYLVSQGSECILLSKAWVKMHADDNTLRTLRSQIAPIPSEKSLQRNLQDKYNWEHFKLELIKSLVAPNA